MKKIETQEEYQQLKQTQAEYNEWAKQYIQKNGWTVIPADAVCPVQFGNDERSALEVWDWLHDPPEKYFLYIHLDNENEDFLFRRKGQAINWMGETLGKVETTGKVYRDSFGGKRVPIKVYGTNGVDYYGIYYKSTGNYARIKRYKMNN